MRVATNRGILAYLVGGALLVGLHTAVAAEGGDAAADITNADRTYRNFTREAAVVDAGQFRLEVRGMAVKNNTHTQINLAGQPARDVDDLTAGLMDLVGTYGFGKNAEVGFIIPGVVESVNPVGGSSQTYGDIADFQMYGKVLIPAATRCKVGVGLELGTPNGPERLGLSTGGVGAKPFLSSRYENGRLGIGAHVGYEFYTGDAVNTFDYGGEVLYRVASIVALRTEMVGRILKDGKTFNDMTFLPGLDLSITDHVRLRPTALVGATPESLNWGAGLGVALTL